MTKAIQILSKNLTGKENILIKETKSQAIKILDSYLFSKNIKNVNFNKISSILTNRVSQIVLTNNNYEKLLSNYDNFNWVIEIKFLPGVTDNIANTANEITTDNITSYKKNLTIGSSNIYLVKGKRERADKIAKKESNPLIHRIIIRSYQKYLNDFKNNKFFGVGNKNYRIATCNEIKKNNKYICTTHPHQIYFEFLSEHGMIGTLIILSIFYKLIFSKILSTIRDNNYIKIGSLIYLIFIFTPIIPSGAFFSDYVLILFAINLGIFYASDKQLNIFKKN